MPEGMSTVSPPVNEQSRLDSAERNMTLNMSYATAAASEPKPESFAGPGAEKK